MSQKSQKITATLPFYLSINRPISVSFSQQPAQIRTDVMKDITTRQVVNELFKNSTVEGSPI